MKELTFEGDLVQDIKTLNDEKSIKKIKKIRRLVLDVVLGVFALGPIISFLLVPGYTINGVIINFILGVLSGTAIFITADSYITKVEREKAEAKEHLEELRKQLEFEKVYANVKELQAAGIIQEIGSVTRINYQNPDETMRRGEKVLQTVRFRDDYCQPRTLERKIVLTEGSGKATSSNWMLYEPKDKPKRLALTIGTQSQSE